MWNNQRKYVSYVPRADFKQDETIRDLNQEMFDGMIIKTHSR